MLRRLLPAGAVVLAAAGCSPPPGAAGAASEATLAAPSPLLAETAEFDAALLRAGPDAERLAAGSDALVARAEALRARAAALGGPVLPPDDRGRLEAARP